VPFIVNATFHMLQTLKLMSVMIGKQEKTTVARIDSRNKLFTEKIETSLQASFGHFLTVYWNFWLKL